MGREVERVSLINMVGVVGKGRLLYGIVRMLLNQEQNVLMVYVQIARLHTTKMATSAVSVIRALRIIKWKPTYLTCPANDPLGKDQGQHTVQSAILYCENNNIQLTATAIAILQSYIQNFLFFRLSSKSY